MGKRFKTNYPGVFYRLSERIGGAGTEKIFYVLYKKDGKLHEEKAGRQYIDDMTPARASHVRSRLIEGKRLSRKEKKALEQARKATEADKWTVQRLWDEYCKGRTAGKSLSTDKSRFEKYLKVPFGNIEPQNILALDVSRLRIKLLKKKSEQTVLHVLNLLTWIVNYGVKNGLCPGLKFHIKKPTARNLVTEDLTSGQIKDLLTAIDNDIHPQAGPMMKMALFTGLRRGEMFKLRWNDIDFDRGFITLRDPKGGQDQTIPLNDSARELLENHPRTKSKYVFPGRGGNQRVNIGQAVNEIKKAAGLPAKFRPLHGLRHVFASMLASSGKVDMYVLQKLLTHKGPAMTQRYAHLRDETLKNASNLAGEIIQKAKELETEAKKNVNIKKVR
ncbi:MAG: tyrosine-type recombinase/integrase [Deltaproteobacteria bacterium]|nr:tyrosine-type recombinase/integrase [Deltaproteobacteria bacterium]